MAVEQRAFFTLGNDFLELSIDVRVESKGGLKLCNQELFCYFSGHAEKATFKSLPFMSDCGGAKLRRRALKFGMPPVNNAENPRDSTFRPSPLSRGPGGIRPRRWQRILQLDRGPL